VKNDQRGKKRGGRKRLNGRETMSDPKLLSAFSIEGRFADKTKFSRRRIKKMGPVHPRTQPSFHE